jgi:hypothetical protein
VFPTYHFSYMCHINHFTKIYYQQSAEAITKFFQHVNDYSCEDGRSKYNSTIKSFSYMCHINHFTKIYTKFISWKRIGSQTYILLKFFTYSSYNFYLDSKFSSFNYLNKHIISQLEIRLWEMVTKIVFEFFRQQ